MLSRQRDSFRQIVTIIVLIVTLIVNGLANTQAFNGLNTGEVSDMFPALFTPAGYVFAIWGVIYVGLILYVIYQALPQQRHNPLLRRIAPWFWLNMIANSVWIVLWHYLHFGLTVVVMAVILLSLIVIYWRFGIGRIRAPRRETIMVHIPFSIYLGWITVALVANSSVFLLDLEWSGWGIAEASWAVIMIFVAAIMGVLMGLRHRDSAYVAVLVWAFVGIAVKQSETTVVVVGALLGAIVVVLGLLLSIFGQTNTKFL